MVTDDEEFADVVYFGVKEYEEENAFIPTIIFKTYDAKGNHAVIHFDCSVGAASREAAELLLRQLIGILMANHDKLEQLEPSTEKSGWN